MKQLETSLSLNRPKRATKKWDLTASVIATKNHRWIVGIPQSPNDEFNRLDETWNESGKLVASYWLPYRLQVGAVLQVVSGLRLAKQWELGGARPIKLGVDLFNALNSNVPLTISYAAGPTFGAISGSTPPRIARLTASFSF